VRARSAIEPEGRRRRALSLSQVVELLLTRESQDHSSVSLTRNAKGETQIEVTVRSSGSGEINTAGEAAREAIRLYDVLRRRYPLANGLTTAAAVDEGSMP